MTQGQMKERTNELGPGAILIHLGLLLFGITAWLTGDLADDYKKAVHSGFTVHSLIGIAAAGFAGLRLLTGLFGPRIVRFSQWMPFTPGRIRLALEDVAGLVRFRLPERPTHQGLAGVVQTFGLFVFLLMAVTGGVLFFGLEPGQKAHGVLHDVKEVHEIGVALVPAFLLMHVGAVVMHALRGKHLWKKILFINDKIESRSLNRESLAGER